jgi:hypothetical protein
MVHTATFNYGESTDGNSLSLEIDDNSTAGSEAQVKVNQIKPLCPCMLPHSSILLRIQHFVEIYLMRLSRQCRYNCWRCSDNMKLYKLRW